MKKGFYLFFILLFANLTFASTASDVRSAKRDVAAIEKQIQKLESQKSSLSAKMQNAQQDLQEAQEKVEALQDKPKSLPYKNALKKTETLPTTIDSYTQSITLLEHQLDSLNKLLTGAQENLQAAEPAVEEEKAAKAQPKEEPVSQLVADDDPCEIGDIIDEDLDDDYVSTSESKASTESEPTTFWGKVKKFFKTLFWIVVGLVTLIICWKISSLGGGGSSYKSSKSSGTKTFDKEVNERNKREIASLESDITHLQSQITRCRTNMNSVNRKSEQKMIDSYKRQIADKRDKIAFLKAHMR